MSGAVKHVQALNMTPAQRKARMLELKEKAGDPMISPGDARARRTVRKSAAYTKAVAEIDAMLAGNPNNGSGWAYFVVDGPDLGLRISLMEDYQAVGWRVTYVPTSADHSSALHFHDPETPVSR